MPAPKHSRRRRSRFVPRLESLESRDLLSGGPIGPFVLTPPAETLDQSVPLGVVSTARPVHVIGALGTGPAGAADVAWYSFTLTTDCAVTLKTIDRSTGLPLNSVLTLYTSDLYNFNELAQDDGSSHNGDAEIDRVLAADPAGSPVTYYVAVSGAGNLYFNPFLSGSGYAGATGEYDLQISAVAANVGAIGPTVLASNPTQGAVLAASPLTIRLDVSALLDQNTFDYSGDANQDITLLSSPTNSFNSNTSTQVAIGNVVVEPTANELQISPAAPLAPGYYEVVLAGNSDVHGGVLRDLNGDALGADALHPDGNDYTLTFQIDGVDGVVGATTSDDTPATARQLGNVTNLGLVQVSGSIGVDPAYSPTSANPNPADQVDLYHFKITGSGRYALGAEVFAARYGSLLSFPGLTLFDSNLNVIAANSGSLNNSVATNQSIPLFSDPALYSGLTAGDYYLGVSSAGNVPDPTLGLSPGVNGVYTPESTDSGFTGYSTFSYVLNLKVQAVPTPPTVTSISITPGSVSSGPPGEFTVKFSEPVDLPTLDDSAVNRTQSGALASVYVLGSNGTKYYPRLVSYDYTSATATFQFLDAVPAGPAQLHLSGALGLTDLGGNPLVGNDRSGDYVVNFTVGGPLRGVQGNPLLWEDAGANGDPSQPQSLGILFEHELQTGVTIKRDNGAIPSPAPANAYDYYEFTVLQDGSSYDLQYQSSTDILNTVPPTLTDLSGNTYTLVQAGNPADPNNPQPNTNLYFTPNLPAGTYILGLGSGTPDPNVDYQVLITTGTSPENPTPLTYGPSPALQISLATTAPSSPTTTPILTLPAINPITPAGNSTVFFGFGIYSSIPSDVLLALGGLPVGGDRGADSGPPAVVPRLALDLGEAAVPRLAVHETVVVEVGDGADANPTDPNAFVGPMQPTDNPNTAPAAAPKAESSDRNKPVSSLAPALDALFSSPTFLRGTDDETVTAKVVAPSTPPSAKAPAAIPEIAATSVESAPRVAADQRRSVDAVWIYGVSGVGAFGLLGAGLSRRSRRSADPLRRLSLGSE